MRNTIATLFLCLGVTLTHSTHAENNIDLKNVKNWDVWYLYGYSEVELTTIEIPYDSLMPYYVENGITGMIGISTPLSPLHVINKNSLPVWFAVFTRAILEEGALEAAYSGKQEILAPHSFVRKNYGTHINWPKHYIEKYYPEITGCFPFVLPFMVPANTEVRPGRRFKYNSNLTIEGIRYFDESNPQGMLTSFKETYCPKKLGNNPKTDMNHQSEKGG